MTLIGLFALEGAAKACLGAAPGKAGLQACCVNGLMENVLRTKSLCFQILID